jgi:hypothetical protein
LQFAASSRRISNIAQSGPPWRDAAVSSTTSRRFYLLMFWGLLAALPAAYIITQIVVTSRNIVFWDEFDTALDLILRIDAGASWNEILGRFVALNNEHRTVTSRLMFAASYWLTGTVNFHVIGAIGNLFFFAMCAVLVAATEGWERRVRMGVLLAFIMFQLEHFESFIWSGASIDHFQVVALAVLAVAALARGCRSGLVIAAIAAVLATFTLAQGNVTWVVGALMLAHARRWRALAGWCVLAVAAIASFAHGFEFNPGHKIAEVSTHNVLHVGRYWLALLGAPVTLGNATYAPFAAPPLLAGMAYLAWRGMLTRQPVAWFSALFAIGALTLIALGRAELAGNLINSRYMVLGALAWSLVVFMALELATEAKPEHPFRPLAWLLPALIVFNVTADLKFAPMIESFVEVRDRAATSFEQYGMDGKGITRLHPRDKHADILMKMAEDRGVYRLPVFSRRVTIPPPQPNPQMITHVDELVANERAITIGGWAMLPGKTAKRGTVYVVLRSAQSNLVFSTVTLQRTDVAAAYKEPRWRFCGFRAVIRRDQLPAQDFTVSVVIAGRGKADLVMTANRLDLTTMPGKALHASPPQ